MTTHRKNILENQFSNGNSKNGDSCFEKDSYGLGPLIADIPPEKDLFIPNIPNI